MVSPTFQGTQAQSEGWFPDFDVCTWEGQSRASLSSSLSKFGNHRHTSTGDVKGIDPAPHIHEHLRYTIMATALRTPSRITTSRLSTLR